MTTDHRYRAHTACRELTAAGIELPHTVQAAHEALQALDDQPPEQPTREAVRDAWLNNNAHDAARLAAEHATHAVLQQGWQDARQTAGARTLAAIRAEEPAIQKQLAAQAAPLIELIERVAALGTIAISTLVRDGRGKDAAAVAEAEGAAERLASLGDLRDQYLTANARALKVNGWGSTTWRDERVVDSRIHGATSKLDALTQGIRAGGKLWFPSIAEATNRAQQIADEERAAARAAAAAEPHGGLAAFGG